MRSMLWLGVVVMVAGAGCATSFTGDAHFPGGVSGCKKHCDSSGLTMESFVYMGEYSSACVCGAEAGAPKFEGGPSASAAGASAGAAVGVVMAMREREREQQQNDSGVRLFR